MRTHVGAGDAHVFPSRDFPWIKVCGVRTFDEIEWCARCGATHVGINAWPESPRFVALCRKGGSRRRSRPVGDRAGAGGPRRGDLAGSGRRADARLHPTAVASRRCRARETGARRCADRRDATGNGETLAGAFVGRCASVRRTGAGRSGRKRADLRLDPCAGSERDLLSLRADSIPATWPGPFRCVVRPGSTPRRASSPSPA